MLRNLIVLPDGTELYSGIGLNNAIQSVTITECVNSETELKLGSVCSSMLEVKLITPRGGLDISAGTEVALFKVDDLGNRTKAGLFTLEKPTRPSAHTYKITAYDRVSWLDMDLSVWVKNLTGWPYRIDTLAQMVCEACGLPLSTEPIPNGDFLVNQPSVDGGVTGRRLMEWIGEIAARFCRANADGEIEFAWYTPSGITVTPSGERFYYQNSLTYEDYEVAQIDAVQIQLAESESGGVWPEVPDGANSYVIKGNRLLLSNITEGIETVLQTILDQLADFTYTPCCISLPSSMDIRAGSVVQIVDPNGKTITACVMTKTQSGQRDKLESTGSLRRDSLSAQNIKSYRDLQIYADAAAGSAVSAMTQQDIYNKLTNNGELPGLFMLDGQLYVNASYMTTGILASKDGESFYLDLDANILDAKFRSMSISGKTVDEIASDEAGAAADSALGDAKSYADSKASSTLSSAKSYADDAASAAAAAVEDDFSSQQKIFNILTNNGETQGIFLKDGKIYINMEYLSAGQIDADRFTLRGLFEVYGVTPDGTEFLGGYIGYKSGDLGNGIVTDGVMLAGPNMDYYVIATDRGVRLQAVDKSLYLTNGQAGIDAPTIINGPLTVNGDITYTGTLSQKT